MKNFVKIIGGFLFLGVMMDLVFFFAMIGQIASGEKIREPNGWWRGHLDIAAKIVNYDREKSIAGK